MTQTTAKNTNNNVPDSWLRAKTTVRRIEKSPSCGGMDPDSAAGVGGENRGFNK